MVHQHKFVLKRRYVHERICPKEAFDPKSFRRVRSNSHIVTVGCPKGQYQVKMKRCKIGLRAQNLLHPVKHFQEKFPSKYEKVKAVGRKGAMLSPSTLRGAYCPT